MASVDLGFVNKVQPWMLRSRFFPHKVGGKPAWLTLNNLPDSSELVCKNCGNPCILLLQLRADIDEKTDTYHRSIFIFMCKNGRCFKPFSNRNFIVFRTQLPQKNNFYSIDSFCKDEGEKSSRFPSAEQFQALCDVCGCKALVAYKKNPERNYCNINHRKNHWDRYHNDIENQTKRRKLESNPLLLPEYQIFKNTEEFPPEYQTKRTEIEVPADDLDCESREENTFNRFLLRIQYDPDQILRYQRGGVPLLITTKHEPTEADIPMCACGAKRIFEFQVMPHLLSVLNFDSGEEQESPDWGTLFVYTCSESCSEGTGAYVQEFLWKQDV